MNTDSRHLLGIWNRCAGDSRPWKLFCDDQFTRWEMHNPGDPFTARDLEDVVNHLRREVRKGERKPGCLRFCHIIENPDNFHEERMLMRQARGNPRNHAPTERDKVLLATGREPERGKPAPVKTAEQALAASKKWQEAGESLAKWKRENL